MEKTMFVVLSVSSRKWKGRWGRSGTIPAKEGAGIVPSLCQSEWVVASQERENGKRIF